MDMLAELQIDLDAGVEWLADADPHRATGAVVARRRVQRHTRPRVGEDELDVYGPGRPIRLFGSFASASGLATAVPALEEAAAVEAPAEARVHR